MMETNVSGSSHRLSEAAAFFLRKNGKLLEKQKGEILFEETDLCPQLYLVEEGYVALYRNSRYGERKVIFICSSGEVLNETLPEGEKTSVAACCLTDVKLLCVDGGCLKDLIDSGSPEGMTVMKALYGSLARKTRRLYHQTGNANRTYPIEKRLAAKLWRLAKEHGTRTDRGMRIPFELTVTMLANMLGAKRETVSRALSDLKKAGCLIHEDGILTVTDMDGLKERI